MPTTKIEITENATGNLVYGNEGNTDDPGVAAKFSSDIAQYDPLTHTIVQTDLTQELADKAAQAIKNNQRLSDLGTVAQSTVPINAVDVSDIIKKLLRELLGIDEP